MKIFAMILMLGLVGCSKDDAAEAPVAEAPVAEAPVAEKKKMTVGELARRAEEGAERVDRVPPVPADARRVPIEVRADGYHPASVEAAPNESLALVFTRTQDTACGEVITVAGTDTRATLPLDQPVEIPVTAPASGEIAFTCGMQMMGGTVTVK